MAQRKYNPLSLRRVLDINFDVEASRSSHEAAALICPEPGCGDRSGNCIVTYGEGLVHCWRCNYGGTVASFLKKHDVEYDAADLEEFVAETSVDELDEILDEDPAEVKAQVVQLPPGFTPLTSEPDGSYSRLIGAMARRKKLYWQDFAEAGVGFTKIGSWEPFAIFPVTELGRTVYYQGRTYSAAAEGGRTKRFPSKKDVPLGASHWLYGYDRILDPKVKTVIVVESILNVLSLRWALANSGIHGVEPVAVFKHKISLAQKKKLLASPATEICIMYDGDATESAWNEARSLADVRHCTVARMPVGIDANDDAELALQRFSERSVNSPANELESLLVD